ncbi:AAA family ATPase [Corallococcus sicarius]|nr:AAA family ATPase [Corallococcus sicarius]
MNKLTRLTIKQFRNVAPTTLEFRPGINVLLGRNAAGKTTLLRLLSTMAGVPDAALQNDQLEVNCHVSGELLDLEHTVTKARVDVPTHPLVSGRLMREDFHSLQQTDSLTFKKKDGVVIIKAELRPNEVIFEHEGKQIRVIRQFFDEPIASVFFALLSSEANASPDSTFHILPLSIKTAGRMDESLEQFSALLKVEAQTDGDGGNWSGSGIPYSMSEMLAGFVPDGSTTATFSLGFLSRAATALGYESANARFDVERLMPDQRRQVMRLSNLHFFFRRPGEEISHERLSYGQKRLLAFFAHADASPDLLIADELVNGLHHDWISACLDELGERQAFLTSQNPLLLDFLRFDSVEEVRQTFILCERASNDAGAQLIWRNPTEDEAESFFLAYQTGIQRVSDILLTKGLW